MADTEHRKYPLPDPERDIDQEFWTLALTTIPKIDFDIHSIFEAMAQKADAEHRHAIAEIDGLSQALAGKMAADKVFSLAQLHDVVGADEAADGYGIFKVGSEWVAQSGRVVFGDLLDFKLSTASNLADLPDPVKARKNLGIWTGTIAEYNAIPLEDIDPDTIYFQTA